MPELPGECFYSRDILKVDKETYWREQPYAQGSHKELGWCERIQLTSLFAETDIS